MPNTLFHTIYQAFEAAAQRRGDHTAVICLGTRYSYATVREMAERFAAALLDLGVTPGDRVMIYLPNSIQWIISWLGIQRMGAVCVPITPIYTPSDLSYIARDSDCSTIICADTNFGYVKRVLTETGIKRVIISRMADLLPWWKRGFGHLFDIIPKGKTATGKDVFSIRAVLTQHAGSKLPDIAPDGQALAEILYTGGTTRHPKGVPLSHELFLTSALEQIRTSEPLIPVVENVILGNAPLFHILGQTGNLTTLLVGGALLVQPKINQDANFDAIYRFQVRSMVGVPTLYQMMLEHDRLNQYDLSSVNYWYSAGDVLPVEVSRRWKERFGTPIFQGYGPTETCGGVAMCPADINTGYDLITWCRKSMVSYKVPQYIEFRDMMPKSKVGKLLRREIRDEEKRRSDA